MEGLYYKSAHRVYGNPKGWCSSSGLVRVELPYLLQAQKGQWREQFLKLEQRLPCAIWELREMEGVLQLTGREPAG